MDEVARYLTTRWKALADANALFTRPQLNLDAASAQQLIDADNRLGDLHGKRVLCLAGGGGRQSAAYALLGAEVIVFDLSVEQLARDQQAAAHYGVTVATQQGDMRDLSSLPAATFDVIDHPYSLNFVPDARIVFEQVARVIKPNGIYCVMCANPFAAGMTHRDWNGDGYGVKRPYQQGERITYEDQEWVYSRDQSAPVPAPQEFRHTLGTLISALVENGFLLRDLVETVGDDDNIHEEPGTWGHFTAVIPPWFTLYTVYRPDVFH